MTILNAIEFSCFEEQKKVSLIPREISIFDTLSLNIWRLASLPALKGAKGKNLPRAWRHGAPASLYFESYMLHEKSLMHLSLQ